ncbi:hypothetical protein AB0G54_36935 [Streptomyces yokosukanensis]|uniref:hypothetical protein n=1 Tax=Streptomyces yokosukanensis TaxID=67386 RepID=UPI00343533B2
MAKDNERTPEEWRELLNNFQYPDDIKEVPRRKRGAAKRAHREAVRRQSAEWVREQRRRDPIRPAGALIIVVVILGLGVGARLLWPGLLGGNHHGTRVTATATPTPGAQDNKPGDPSTSSATPSSSPSAKVDLSDPDGVAKKAVSLYLTRNPPADGDHSAPVLRAAPYMTPSLVQNLTGQEDPAWDKLVSNGGVSTVSTVKVGPADKGLPVDTPLRVWRKATATVDVEGYKNYTETTVLQVEMTNADGSGWRVSRILGL